MAAIKVQSLNDITIAYLRNLGLSEALAPEWEEQVSEQGDVIAALDNLLLSAAEQLYPEKHYNKAQKIAGFKLAWLRSGYSQKLLPGQKLEAKELDELRSSKLEPAPLSKPQKMQPQALEMPHLKWTDTKA